MVHSRHLSCYLFLKSKEILLYTLLFEQACNTSCVALLYLKHYAPVKLLQLKGATQQLMPF